MSVDIIGTLLSILLVSIRYWYIVLVVCSFELLLTILLSLVIDENITQVIAGGIFSTIEFPGGKSILPILSSLFVLGIALAHLDKKIIRWIDMFNPFADFKKPWPIIMLKTAIYKIIFFILILGSD